jgi:hypothetical protein
MIAQVYFVGESSEHCNFLAVSGKRQRGFILQKYHTFFGSLSGQVGMCGASNIAFGIRPCVCGAGKP